LRARFSTLPSPPRTRRPENPSPMNGVCRSPARAERSGPPAANTPVQPARQTQRLARNRQPHDACGSTRSKPGSSRAENRRRGRIRGMADFRYDERARVGYFRFEFVCGCEFLTRGENQVMYMELSCQVHGENRCEIYGLDVDGYWIPLLGNSNLQYPSHRIPANRGIHPDERDFRRRQLQYIDAEELAEEAVKYRYREISMVANALVAIESPEGIDSDMLGVYKKEVDQAEPDILSEARMAIARFRKRTHGF
jgi:hypothetical protein